MEPPGSIRFELLQVNPEKDGHRHDGQREDEVDPLEGVDQRHAEDHHQVENVEDDEGIGHPDVLEEGGADAHHLEDAHDGSGDEEAGDHLGLWWW